MTLSLVQNDTAQTQSLNNYCSAAGGTIEAGRQAAVGATAGTLEYTASVASQAVTDNELSFECVIANGADGAAGTWTIPINFTTGNKDATLEEVAICQVRASVNIATIGSETGIGFDTTSGSTTRNITGSAVTWVDGDFAVINLAFSNGNTHSARTVGITPNQTITSPFTIAAAGGFGVKLAGQRNMRVIT